MKGRLVLAGESVILLSAVAVKDAEKLFKLFGHEKAKLMLEYSAVYEEKWRVEGMLEQPVRLE
ncbi:MAG: hypothetical protein IT258_19325 [Saprospiraceae bacterium]|nr:hypothetical protein [Saprospiraceae bacterium]